MTEPTAADYAQFTAEFEAGNQFAAWLQQAIGSTPSPEPATVDGDGDGRELGEQFAAILAGRRNSKLQHLFETHTDGPEAA